MRKVIFGLRPADTLTILFLLFFSLLTIIFYQVLPKAPSLLSTYLILFISQVLVIIFKDKGNVIGLFHDLIFPTVCVLVVFDSLGDLIHYINPEDLDPILIRLDYLIFHSHPTVVLEKIMSPLLTDIMQLAYTTYYFIPISFAAILLVNHQREEFNRTLFLILFCFYLSYIGYILMPALGPRFTIRHLQNAELQGLFITGPIQDFINQLEGIKRDAFPSGHTAIPLVVLYLACRFKRRLFWVFLPVVSALIFSTVYCRYHYVVDVFAGFGLAVVAIFFGEKYYGWWIKGRQKTPLERTGLLPRSF